MQLARSESASAGSGFSWKPWIRPAESVITTPNSLTSETRLTASVAMPSLAVVGGAQRGEVDVGEGVGGHHQEGLVAEEVGDVPDAPCSAQQLLLVAVGEVDPQSRAVAEAIADRVREPVQVGDHRAEAVPAQEPQDVLHDRAVRHRHQRLGDLVGERPQAGPQARRHHHRSHQIRPVA